MIKRKHATMAKSRRMIKFRHACHGKLKISMAEYADRASLLTDTLTETVILRRELPLDSRSRLFRAVVFEPYIVSYRQSGTAIVTACIGLVLNVGKTNACL